MKESRKIFADRIGYCDHPYRALEGADALAIITEWNEFRRPDFDRMKTLLKRPVIFDGRNLYEPGRMHARGFTYFAMGRPWRPPTNSQH